MKYFEDVRVGDVMRFGRYEVTRDEIVEYARQFDPQPFHLDEEAARQSFFGGLSASGWHTASMTMRLMVQSAFRPAGGIIGSWADELKWPRPVMAGDVLHVEVEVLEVRPSRSRPGHGFVKVRMTTLNQESQPVQVLVMTLFVRARAAAP